MSNRGTKHLLRSWQTLLDAGSVAALTDAALVERFATRRDAAGEAAFAAIVARHGPMVRRVCRRLLDDPNDAEDAFQATFLVLARKAPALRQPERLANWLYGTAHRTSRKLKVQAARRFRHEARAARAEPVSDADLGRSEEARIVLDEIARLPGPCRSAVVLCELEGRPQDEAARSLGCSDRTIRRRLARAHRLLRARLAWRGLAPTSGLIAAALAPETAGAAMPMTMADALTRAALAFAAGEVAVGTVPAPAISLARGVIRIMFADQIKAVAIATGSLLTLGIGAGVGLGFSSPLAQGTPQVKESVRPRPAEPSPAEQYRDLVRRYEGDLKAYQDAAYGKTQDEVIEIWKRLAPDLAAYATRFVSLAERYPRDPAAVDALIWVVEGTLSASDQWESPLSRLVGRAIEILARDHPGEPRLGPLCAQLTAYPSPRRDVFLRAIAERSTNRVAKGQATLALAEYLGMKAAEVEMIQDPDAPGNLEKMKALIASTFGPDAVAHTNPPLTDAAATLRKQREELAEHAPVYLKRLLTADPAPMRGESEAFHARVIREFGDVPYVRLDKRPTRETLADAALRSTRPGVATSPPGLSFRKLDES